MKKRIFLQVKIAAYLLLPIVLLILPAGFFDHGKSICLSQLLLQQECPGCGMTRAVMHLVHADFSGAAQYNKLCFIVLPLLAYVWFTDLLRDIRYIRKSKAVVS